MIALSRSLFVRNILMQPLCVVSASLVVLVIPFRMKKSYFILQMMVTSSSITTRRIALNAVLQKRESEKKYAITEGFYKGIRNYTKNLKIYTSSRQNFYPGGLRIKICLQKAPWKIRHILIAMLDITGFYVRRRSWKNFYIDSNRRSDLITSPVYLQHKCRLLVL